MSVKHSFKDLQGKKVLITGEVRTGKTRLTLELLDEAIELGLSKGITVIDMAPATVVVGGKKFGGKLLEFSDVFRDVRYLTPQKVEAPRLSAKSAEELLHLVHLNEKQIRFALEEYEAEPTPILFVNDVSIYLQSGFDEPVSSAMRAAETFIANGYYGRVLESAFGTHVSDTERRLMEKLVRSVDVVIKL